MNRIPFLFIVFILMPITVLAQTQVGTVAFSRGVTTAELTGEAVRVVGESAAVYEGDILTTGEKSFVVIEFVDGTRMSLRPNTVFQLEMFKQEQNQAELRLHAGGLRASTGEISKNNPDGFKLHANNTTTAVRDAEFDVRICDDECGQEAERYQTKSVQSQQVVGRVAEVKGTLTVVADNRDTRIAVTGAPLYQGDELTTGSDSYAVIAFRDQGRITLQEETTFKVDKLRFEQSKPNEGEASFDLIRGGLRALTGVIGKEDKDDYSVNTPVATIGIRGTGFDLVCVGQCVKPNKNKIDNTAVLSIGDGLYASVWKGSIVIKTESGQLVLSEGAVVVLPDSESESKSLPHLPPFFNGNPAPRPDLIFIDHQNLFATYPIKSYRFGLFFAVYKGHLTTVNRTNEKLDLGRQEALSFDVDKLAELIRLERVPELLSEDPYFKAIDESFWLFYDPLDEDFDDFFECTIQ